MRQIRFLMYMLLASLAFASCDLFETEEEKETSITWKRFFDIRVTRCERVGSVLQVEYDLTNKSGEAKTFTIGNTGVGTATDDLGQVYGTTGHAFGDSEYNESRSVYVERGATVKGKFKVYDFDTSGKARKVSTMNMSCSVSGETLTDKSISFVNLDITDNRVIGQGVMTCDTLLDFRVTRCEHVGEAISLDYEVPNKGSEVLRDFTVWQLSPISVVDNLGAVFEPHVAFGEADFRIKASITLQPRQTVMGRIHVQKFGVYNVAKSLSVNVGCSAANYVFSDSRICFMNIPIEDNRVMSGGAMTCDHGLAFSVSSCRRTSEGRGVLNYTVRNNTGRDLHNFNVSSIGLGASDDLNNVYHYDCAFSGSNYNTSACVDLAAGSTVSGSLMVRDFNSRARSLTVAVKCFSDSYVFDDNTLRFISVPVTD